MPRLFHFTTLSLRKKVIFSIILLLVVMGGLFSFMTVRSIHVLLEEIIWKNYIDYTRSFAAFSAKSFAEGDLDELQRHLDIAYVQKNIIFLVARRTDGAVAAHKGEYEKFHPVGAHEHVFVDEQVDVREIGAEPGGLFHAAGHNFLITSDVSYDGKRIGAMQVAVNTAVANQRLAAITVWGFEMALAIVALGTVILIVVDRRLKRNLSRLIQISGSMAAGDLSQRVEIRTGDEVEKLGESFNLMAEAISAHEEQLEHLVEQRTEELQKEKNKLQLILDNVPSAFLLLDDRLRVESVSSQFERVLDKNKADVLGRECALCKILGFQDESCPSRRALKTGEVKMQEGHILDAAGEDVFLEHIAIPIKSDGRVEKVLEIVTDITSRKRLREQLIRTERLSATGEMAAIIAHEIRNSLSSVNLILQCLTDSESRADEEAQSIDVAIQSVNRMEFIVRQLLEFAKPAVMKPEPSSIAALVEQSLDFCKYQFQRKGVKLVTTIVKDLPLVSLDAEMMREALINLFLNATDAVSDGGRISVQAQLKTLKRAIRAKDAHLTRGFRRGDQVLELRVADDGCGIGADDIARIFDPFHTTKTHGTGLGLTMAKRTVTNHGGVMQVESELRKGSSFTVLLPISQT